MAWPLVAGGVCGGGGGGGGGGRRHLSVSARICAANSAALLPTACMPCACSLSRICGICSALRIFWFCPSTMAGGVPAGARRRNTHPPLIIGLHRIPQFLEGGQNGGTAGALGHGDG